MHYASSASFHGVPAMNRTVAILSSAACLWLFAAACDGDGLVGPAPGASLVEGSIAYSKTGVGVPNVLVALIDGDEVVAATPTDADGHFAFDDVEAGSYTVRLTCFDLAGIDDRETAFEPVERDIVVADETLSLVFAAVSFVPARIVGTLTCGGTPVAGVNVRVVGGETDQIVATNGQGRYGANDLGEGWHTVIPQDPACAIDPGYDAVFVRPGQSVDVSFDG
jgi:hypothetical protein